MGPPLCEPRQQHPHRDTTFMTTVQLEAELGAHGTLTGLYCAPQLPAVAAATMQPDEWGAAYNKHDLAAALASDTLPRAGFVFATFASHEAAAAVLRASRDWPRNTSGADREVYADAGFGCRQLRGTRTEVTYARDDAAYLASSLLNAQIRIVAEAPTLLDPDTTRPAGVGRPGLPSAAPGARHPLPFETHGTAYVFDAPSRLFYERTRNFWYDPTSRLYQDGASGAFCRRVWDGGAWTFQPYVPPPTASASAAPTVAAAVAAAPQVTSTLPPAPVAFVRKGGVAASGGGGGGCGSIGSSGGAAVVGGSGAGAPVATIATAFDGEEEEVGGAAQPVAVASGVRIAKKNVINTRGKAPSAPDAATSVVAALPAVIPAAALLPPVPRSPAAVVPAPPPVAVDTAPLPPVALPGADAAPATTAAIVAACKLCSRGFASEAQLGKHVAKSALHRDNVGALMAGSRELPPGVTLAELAAVEIAAGVVGGPIEAAAAAAAAAAESAAASGAVAAAVAAAPGGRDRAAERRQMVGIGKFVRAAWRDDVGGGGGGSAPPPPRVPSAAATLASAAVRPIDVATNVGAALLKKMGWREGDGLGRRGQGRLEPVDAAAGGADVEGSRRGVGMPASSLDDDSREWRPAPL